MLLAAAAFLVAATVPAAPDPVVDGNVPVVATVERLAGADRYETAAAIARTIDDDTVVIVTGESFPDALVAAGTGHPVLLVTRHDVPAPTARELARREPERIIVIGGRAAVSEDLARAIGADERIAGRDRYATAARVAAGRDAYVADGRTFGAAAPMAAAAVRDGKALVLVAGPVAAAPSRGGDAVLASERSFADALTAATLGRTLVLVPPTCVPDGTRARLEQLRPWRITLVGGSGAIDDAVGEMRSCALPATVTYEFGAEVTHLQRAYVRGAVDAARRRVGDPGPIVVQAFTDLDEMVAANVRSQGGAATQWREWWDSGAAAMGNGGWIGVNLDATLEWFPTTSSFMEVVVHEVVHARQQSFGDAFDVPTWLVEGSAEWLATETSLAEGWTDEDLRGELLESARWGIESLAGYEDGGDDGGEYFVGFAGCEYLVELAGTDSALLDLFRAVADGSSWQDALSSVTGLPMERFYEQFPEWLEGQ